MKQRYHYNVANTRVDQHVEKGNDDGLYISSVACCHELWALIMDAGTGFSAQVSACSCPLGKVGHQSCIVSLLHICWPQLKCQCSAECCLCSAGLAHLRPPSLQPFHVSTLLVKQSGCCVMRQLHAGTAMRTNAATRLSAI